MSYHQTTPNKYQIAPRMMLVQSTSYQHEPIPMLTGSPQPIPMVSQYKDPSVVDNHSFKNNRIALQEPGYNPYSRPDKCMRFKFEFIN